MNHRAADAHQIVRGTAYAALSLVLVSAVLLHEGVEPAEWQWLAAILSVASGACVLARVSAARRGADDRAFDLWILAGILAWVILQIVPLPPSIVQLISPERWKIASAARSAAGYGLTAWLPLSVAPPSSLAQLLYVVPYMAAFLGARELARAWGKINRLWLLIAPVLVIATFQSLVGLGQYFESAGVKDAPPATGSYVNYDHFSGLLEMALPLATMWAAAVWIEARIRQRKTLWTGLGTAALLGVAVILLAGIVVSSSRMGFLIAVTLVGLLAAMWSIERREAAGAFVTWKGWLFPILLPVAIAILVPTNALLLRFAGLPGAGDVADDGRVQIWRASMDVVKAYPLTGVGLGAFQQGMYPFELGISTLTAGFAHNDYLQIVAELGLPGLVLFAALGVYIFRKLIRVAARPDSKNWALAAGLLGSLVAIGLHSLVDFNLYIPANALIFAWLAGIAASPSLRRTREGADG